MAGRCCGGADCTCIITGGENTGVTGSGTFEDPYVITSSFQAQDAVAEHVADPEDAHAASAIEFTPSGGISADNVQDAIVQAASAAATGVIPVGTVIMGGWTTAPVGYILCDGASYTTAAQADLFAAIGYAYGGSGGNFNVPNLKGKVPVGRDAAQTEFDSLGETGGSKTHTMTSGEIAGHTHTIDHDHGSTSTAAGGTHTHGLSVSWEFGFDDGASNDYAITRVGGVNPGDVTGTATGNTDAGGSHTHTVDLPNYTGSSGSTGSATPFSILQPYQTFNFAIKAT